MTDTGIDLNIDEIQKRIPHRPPMLLIDRIISLIPDQSAVGIRMVSVTDPVFAGHFPDYPIMPGVLIVEAMAQTAACVACVTRREETRGKLVFFTTIENARFRRPVRPGDLLELHVEKVTSKGSLWKFRGVAMVEGKKVAEADFGAMIVDPGN